MTIEFSGITDSDGNALFEINSPISLHYSQSLTGGVFIVSPRSILYSTFDGSNPENLYLYKGSRFQYFGINTSGTDQNTSGQEINSWKSRKKDLKSLYFNLKMTSLPFNRVSYKNKDITVRYLSCTCLAMRLAGHMSHVNESSKACYS